MQGQALNVDVIASRFREIQDQCCSAIEDEENGAVFREDNWDHSGGGGGRTRVLEGGLVIEKGGINFSMIKGSKLPGSASVLRQNIADKPFVATGVSLVMHPVNPFAPTSHMNIRFFISDPESKDPIWWFGGGYDLTPYYGFEEDCIHWHTVARNTCNQFNDDYYGKFKTQCDDYFFLKHRNEPRGIGGLFFDDLNEEGFDSSFQFVQAVGTSFIDAYVPILSRRKSMEYDDHHRNFQLYRRGRYVEFNLVYDRGTLFGLQSNGRTESILMSLPPKVEWAYNRTHKKGSEEEKLMTDFLIAKNWV